MELKIIDEIKNLIPPLSKEEYGLLKQSIIKEGVRDPIIVWSDMIVDGHNRYTICKKHNISFKIVDKDFTDLDEIKIWVIENQLGRRNLTDEQKSYFIGKLYNENKKQHRGDTKVVGHNVPLRTSVIIADEKGINEKTVRRNAVYSSNIDSIKEVDAELANNILSGKIKATRNEISRLVSKDPIIKKQIIDKVKESDISLSEASREVTQSNLEDSPLPDNGKYRVIYADPPWLYDSAVTAPTGNAAKEYKLMSIEDICAMPIKNIVEDDAVLFLWVTSPKLPLAFDVIKAWGFEYKTSIVWDKIGHNVGYYVSVRHEFLLIAGRGKATPDSKTLHDSVISIQKSKKHSQKPDYFRELIDTMYTTGKKLQLFSRETYDGWDNHGNELL